MSSWFGKNDLSEAKETLERAQRKLSKAQEDLKDRKEVEKTREEHFQKALVGRLTQAYLECKKLTEDSQQPNWPQYFSKLAADALEVVAKAGAVGGVAYFVGGMLGGKQAADSAGLAAGVCSGLVALWNVKEKHHAIEHAKGFLAMVEDIKDDRKAIDERMRQIANVLCSQFRYAIRNLCSHDEGTDRLASFLTIAIVRDFPKIVENPEIRKVENGKYTEYEIEEVIRFVVKSAIPSNEKDDLYQKWWKNIELKGDYSGENSKNWTLPGLLFRAPIYDESTQKYLVRDGKLGKENRSEKYPAQYIKGRPIHYLLAKQQDKDAINKRMEGFKLDQLQKYFERREKKLKDAKEQLQKLSPGIVRGVANEQLKRGEFPKAAIIMAAPAPSRSNIVKAIPNQQSAKEISPKTSTMEAPAPSRSNIVTVVPDEQVQLAKDIPPGGLVVEPSVLPGPNILDMMPNEQIEKRRKDLLEKIKMLESNYDEELKKVEKETGESAKAKLDSLYNQGIWSGLTFGLWKPKIPNQVNSSNDHNLRRK